MCIPAMPGIPACSLIAIVAATGPSFPFTTLNRRVHGELGRFALDLGDGYMIHGTPDESSVGKKATHGCLRLHDEDIEWMYQNVREGTPVYVY